MPGGGLYKMFFVHFSNLLQHFTTVPNTDAVSRGLLGCCHKLLGDGS